MRDVEALTGLLNAAQSGDADAARSAYEMVYAELKRRARNSLRSARPDDTLTPTALVHEVYLRFNENAAQPLRDRSHFYALAARAMRQILVDHARRRHADKRGGGAAMMSLDEVAPAVAPPNVHRHAGDRSGARRARRVRAAVGSSLRAQVLRRAHDGRNRGRARRVAGDRETRLGRGQGVASRSALEPGVVRSRATPESRDPGTSPRAGFKPAPARRPALAS